MPGAYHGFAIQRPRHATAPANTYVRLRIDIFNPDIARYVESLGSRAS